MENDGLCLIEKLAGLERYGTDSLVRAAPTWKEYREVYVL